VQPLGAVRIACAQKFVKTGEFLPVRGIGDATSGGTMKDTITTLSKTQQDFLAWYEGEKLKGLKDIKFYPGDTSQATVDSFIEELKNIDKAIESKRFAPFPESF
jgi:hypothetical protein